MRYFLLCLILSGCVSSPQPVPMPTPDPAIARAVGFLASQMDLGQYLLRESPETAPDVIWTQTDNKLCALALGAIEPELAARLRFGLSRFPNHPHGLIEALGGSAIEIPPHVARPLPLSPSVRAEIRTDGAIMADWAGYADLTLYAALSAFNIGDIDKANSLYADALKMWDGVGFADVAFVKDGRYATYKIALAAIVGDRMRIGAPPGMWDRLLSLQDANGGFFALYDEDGRGVNDSNVETSCYALLAMQNPPE